MIRLGLYSDDADLRLVLSSSLPHDFELLSETTEQDLCDVIASGVCNVILLDLKSPNAQQRFEACRRLILAGSCSVVMADDDRHPAANELLKIGADDYCSRRSPIEGIGAIVRKAYEVVSRRRQRKNGMNGSHAAHGCGQMVGSSSCMRAVYEQINAVADLSVSVLITGESGTGKELIARAIHTLGSRSEQPFVAVAAGAIPDTLLQSELFGHEKGAFTGSVAARRGYFEEAGNGTLFLDEIADISMRAQVMLLRALQQREFNHLGSSRLIPLRSRIIFATHRDIDEMVAFGDFRDDLFYRINVISIRAPALRERPEDVPEIADHYLHQYARMYGKSATLFDPEAISLLQSYTWPGNVRELENVVQRAAISAKGPAVQVEDLKLNIDPKNIVCIDDHRSLPSFEQRVRDYKRKVAELAILEHNGNKTQAAKSLQITRAYLHRLLHLSDGNEFLEEGIDEAGAM